MYNDRLYELIKWRSDSGDEDLDEYHRLFKEA